MAEGERQHTGRGRMDMARREGTISLHCECVVAPIAAAVAPAATSSRPGRMHALPRLGCVREGEAEEHLKGAGNGEGRRKRESKRDIEKQRGIYL